MGGVGFVVDVERGQVFLVIESWEGGIGTSF